MIDIMNPVNQISKLKNCNSFDKLNFRFSGSSKSVYPKYFKRDLDNKKGNYRFQNDDTQEDICFGTYKDCHPLVNNYIASHPEVEAIGISTMDSSIDFSCMN